MVTFQMSQNLYDEWASLWHRLHAKGPADRTFEALNQSYATPPRAYHNLNHIAHCLDEFRSSRHLALNPDALAWALWFHDAIYDSQAKDNEQQSAGLAQQVASEAGLSPTFINQVISLILATTHISPPAPGDEALITDIDLAILGQPPAKFDEYERQIREEYAWVDDALFTQGRSTVLASFLVRPAIYQTEWFGNKYEKLARENLGRSLANWKAASLSRPHAGPIA